MTYQQFYVIYWEWDNDVWEKRCFVFHSFMEAVEYAQEIMRFDDKRFGSIEAVY